MLNPVVAALIAASVHCAAAFTAVPYASAQQSPSAPQGAVQAPDVVLTDTLTMKATVEAVDQAQREVTLRGEDGQTAKLKVDKTVRNLDQVQPGDQLTVEFLAATAVFIRTPEAAAGAAGSSPPAAERSAMVAPRGDKPAGVMTETVQVTATIDDIDYAKRQAVLRGPQGNLRRIHVDDRIENLERFKKGDTVLIKHTEAVAIAVTK
jgi:hypothetical protein